MLVIASVHESDVGEYRCHAANAEGSSTSQPALLQTASESGITVVSSQGPLSYAEKGLVTHCM